MEKKEAVRLREEWEMWSDEYRKRGEACNQAVESYKRKRRTLPGTRLTAEEFSKIDGLRQSASEAKAKRDDCVRRLRRAGESIQESSESDALAVKGRKLHNEMVKEAQNRKLPIWSFAEAIRMAKDGHWTGYQADVRDFMAETFGVIQPVTESDGSTVFKRVPIALKEHQFLIPRFPINTIEAYQSRIARLCEDANYYPTNGTGQLNSTTGTGGDLNLTNYDYSRMVGPEFASDWMDRIGVPTVSEARVGKTKIPTIPTVGGVTIWSGEGPGVSLSSNTTDYVEYTYRYASWAWSQTMLSEDLTPSEATAFLFTNIAERQIKSSIAALAIHGTGSTGFSGQPTGILNHTDVHQISMGTNGGALTHKALVDMWTYLQGNHIEEEPLYYLMNASTIGKASITPTIPGGNNQMLTAPEGTVWGSPVVPCSALPKDVTVGTATNTSVAVMLSPMAILRYFYGPMRFSYEKTVLNGATVGCMTQPFDLAVHDPQRVVALTGIITE